MLWPLGPSLLAVEIIYHWQETTDKRGSLTQCMGISCPGCASRIHPGTTDVKSFYKWYFLCTRKVCNLYNYADDNTLLNTHHAIADLKYNLETSATVAIQWFDVNGMKSNQAEFQAMILNNQPDKVIYPCVAMIWTFHWNLVWNYWAIFLDYELNFSDHVAQVCKRASRQLNAVRRVAKIS